MARVPYTISPIDSNKTILELLKEIQIYLAENRIFEVITLNKLHTEEITRSYIQGIGYPNVTGGDVLVFSDGYVGVIQSFEPSQEEPYDEYYPVIEAFIDMRGLRGVKGDTGVSITRIVKTSTSGLVDTYTIYLSDGSTSTFTVTNGERGEGSSKAITSIDTSVGVANVTYDSEDGATIESSGTVSYDDGTSESINVSREIPIVSSDEIVFDATEDNAHVSAHLQNDISSRIQKSLITPMTAPSDTKLVAIDTSNAQTNISVGDGLSIENGTLKASGGSGGSGDLETLWSGSAYYNSTITIENVDLSKYDMIAIWCNSGNYDQATRQVVYFDTSYVNKTTLTPATRYITFGESASILIIASYGFKFKYVDSTLTVNLTQYCSRRRWDLANNTNVENGTGLYVYHVAGLKKGE